MAASVNTGGLYTHRSFIFALAPAGTDWDATTAVEVNLAYDADSLQNLKAFIDTTTFLATSAYESYSGDYTSATLGAATNTYAYGTDMITVKTALHNPATSSDYLTFRIGAVAGADVGLPMVASNMATFYETWATATTGSQVEIYNYVYSVFAKDATADVISLPLCADILEGIPFYSLFTAIDSDITFGTDYVLQIDLGADQLGNQKVGYADGDEIPFDGTVSDATVTYDDSGKLLITGLGTVAKGDTVTTFIVWSNSWATTADTGNSVTTTLYYTVDTNDEQYVLYTATQTWDAKAIGTTDITGTFSKTYSLDATA